MNQIIAKNESEQWFENFVESVISEYQYWVTDFHNTMNSAFYTMQYRENFFEIFPDSHGAYEEYLSRDLFDKPYEELTEEEEQEIMDAVFGELYDCVSLPDAIEKVLIDRHYFVICKNWRHPTEASYHPDDQHYHSPLQEVW